MSDNTPSPQSVVVLERAEYERLIGVAEDLISNTQDPGTEALAAVYCARRILAAPAPSSLAGGEVEKLRALLERHQEERRMVRIKDTGAVYDTMLDLDTKLVLAALSPEARDAAD